MYNLEHLLVSIGIQAAIGLTTGNWWAGGAVAAAMYVGREQAQAEYRWIAQLGDGKRENLRWWNALDSKVWNTHNFFWNLALPIVAVTIIGLLA